MTTVDRLGMQVWRTAALCCALLCAFAAAAAFSAGAARAAVPGPALTWLGPTSLIPSGGTKALPTVSCEPTGQQCTAVDGKGEEITFNASSGAIVSRAAVDALGAAPTVSCPSTTQCSVVDNGGNEVTFNPSTGAINAGGRASIDSAHHLTAVSCAAGSTCTAVDNAGNEVTFNPANGSVPAGVQPIDSTAPQTAVSCVAVSGGIQCVSVDNGGNETTVTINPTSTSAPAVSTNPIDSTRALTGVSCPSAGVCSAVDGSGYEVSFDPAPYSLIGSVTQIDTTTGVALTGVSCPSTSTCVATDSLGNAVSYAPTATPAPSVNSVDGTTYLNAVSCPAGSSSCNAVDNRNREVSFTTAGSSTGSHLIAAPALASVSCPSRTQCTSVASGSSEITYDPTTNPATVNGAGISVIDHSGNPLTSISCISTTLCTAVDSGGNEATFNPTTGNVIANGFISVDSNALRSVACLLGPGASPATTAPQCTAVDTAGNEVTFNPQTSTQNNAGLSQVDNSPSVLQSVSCPTGTQCTAVDNHGNEVTFNPVSGNYYGTQQFVTVDPSESLTSVVCTSTTSCTAVDNGGGVITIASPADGVNPVVIPSRQQIELGTISLNSLSCPTATECTAVDDHGAAATFDPTDPTSESSTALTALPQANALQAVACQSTSVCAAVDNEGNGFSGIQPPSNTALPSITGQAQQSQVLTEHDGSFTNFPASHAYVWESCTSATDPTACNPIAPAATNSTYTPVATDIGRYIRVQDTATNAGGSDSALSPATLAVTPSPATNNTAPTITSASSFYQVGSQLVEHDGTWSENSSATETHNRVWEDCNSSGNACQAITGATGATYTPTTDDIGHTIVVTDQVDNGGTPVPSAVPSTATAVIRPAPAANTAAPTIFGTAQEGQTLTEHHGTWTNATGPTAYSYQWQSCDQNGNNCSSIPGATAQTYTLTAGDVGTTLVVLETADNGGRPVADAASSQATQVIVPRTPSAVSPPTIAGAVAQGQTLTEGHGVWSSGVDAPTGYSYQWESCDASGANCARIAGATAPTYTPTTGDVGHAIVVLETATDAGGSSAPVASAPTAPAAPAAAPPIAAASQGASPVTTNSATVHALLQTQGLPVSWQFVYGTTTNYTAGTPVQTLTSGAPSSATLAQPLAGLKPGTTYHYRIVETVAATPYSPAATAYGQDRTFTTTSLGRIALGTTKLAVTPAGGSSVPLQCESTVSCVDRFSITTTTQIGHGARRHLATVLCNTDFTRVAAEKSRNIAITLTKGCMSLLQAAKGQHILATFTTRPRSGQLGLVQKITLAIVTSGHSTKAQH